MMTTFKSRWILFGVIALTLSSCSFLSNGDDDMVIDVTQEFSVTTVENYHQSGPSILLKVKTIDPLCEDAQMDVITHQDHNTLEIRINKISKPDSCLLNQAILSQNVDFEWTSSPEYKLIFSLKGLIDNVGSIVITDDEIITQMPDAQGVIASPEVTYRLPEHTIWGYASSHEVDYAGRIIDFVTDLSIISKPIVLKKGEYANFQITESGRLVMDHQTTKMNDATFFYKFEGDEQLLIDLLDQYRTDAGTKAEFKIFSTSGKVY